ncbi:hypothetical protein T484DRAFT_1861423 [Baffinella frigidus]|nr:hypothetical protein T484DRAFT_1861423 [Cryptophyta sp. CCMP2293]
MARMSSSLLLAAAACLALPAAAFLLFARAMAPLSSTLRLTALACLALPAAAFLPSSGLPLRSSPSRLGALELHTSPGVESVQAWRAWASLRRPFFPSCERRAPALLHLQVLLN